MSENVSIDEVCRPLEALDEWEEVALHLGLSDETVTDSESDYSELYKERKKKL